MSLHARKPPVRPASIIRGAGCSVSAMVDPVGTGRSHRHILSGYAPWITATQTCLMIALLVMAGGVIGWCRPAQGADQPPAAQISAPNAPLTFDEAVRIAITQSPAFTKSSVDIEIRRMDETDSRYAMVPPLTFQTNYYVARPGSGYGKPYSFSFTTNPYNPVGAYFSLQAQKLASKVAVFSHLSLISQGLESLGSFYLSLDALHKLAGYQQDLIKVAQENLTYAENQLTIGTGTSLEVKVAQQELQLARGEQEGIDLGIKRTLTALKNFLGLRSNQTITPVFQDSRRQVLGSFNPDTITLEQAKSHSFDLKALEIFKQLQSYNVSLAIAKSFPTFTLNTQTPDPLSVSTGGYGLYVGLGVQIPVWDGFSRIRDVSRQKAVLRQADARIVQKEDQLEDKWLSQLGQVHDKNVTLKNTQSLEELARLKANQQEVRYHSGEAPLPVFLESRKVLLRAQKDTVTRGLDYDKAVLKAREITGDLGNTYVDANSWQK